MFFPYEFDRRAQPFLRLVGARADRDGVRVDDERVVATFGPFNATIERSNIKAVSVTGPYRWYKAIGPRLSAADHGLTFGTTTAGGVCIEFHQPIRAVFGPWAHPGVTLTVADPNAFAATIGPGL